MLLLLRALMQQAVISKPLHIIAHVWRPHPLLPSDLWLPMCPSSCPPALTLLPLSFLPCQKQPAAPYTEVANHHCYVLQVYLSGQEIPSLYITYYWTGRAALQHVSVLNGPLESALQQLVGNPALALPHSGGMAAGLLAQGPRIACPVGQAHFVDEEVEQWIEAAGLQKLHSAAYKVKTTTSITMFALCYPAAAQQFV